MNQPKVTVGLYRHFKGKYYYVTGLSKSATDEKTILVNYFDVCNPQFGSFTRPLDDFVAEYEYEKEESKIRFIVNREDNVTGQYMRFERVKDLNFQLGSVSTEQLIEELRTRTDSPIHELDLAGLHSPVFSRDYIIGVPYDNPEYSRGVDTLVVFDTEEQAKKYTTLHKLIRSAGIYKRTFIRLD